MFEDFLYLLRKNGLKVSLTEWMALVEAMHKGLHSSSFTGFYHLCRCLLVKSEADFDTFDRCFLEYFKDVPFQQEVSQELLDWLNRPEVLSDYASWDEEQALKNLGFSEEEIEAGTFVAEETDGQEHVYGISAERLYGLLNQGVDTRDLYIACTSYTQNTEYALKMIAWLGEQTQEEPPAWLEELEPIMDEETAQSLPEIG